MTDASPERLQQVEDRLALLERLKRKYGPTLDDVIGRRDACAQELELLERSDESRAALLKKTTAAKQNPWLKPIKVLYRGAEQILARLNLADNLFIVLRKK